MQLKKLSLLVLAATATTPVLNAASSDEVKFSQTKYTESDNRMEIDFSLLDIKKDIGTDYTLSASLTYDTMSGGTPVWDTVSAGSAVVSGKSNDPRCANNLCQDTSTNKELLTDGEANMNNYKYKNVQVDDTRKAIALSLVKRTAKRDEITTGLAYSKEEDFKSAEVSLGYLYNIDKSRNSSITAGVSFQKNSALHRRDNNQWKDFDVVNFQVGYTKIFTKKFLAQANYFYTKQSGTLTNPYQTIIRYFNISKSAFDPVHNYFIAKEKRPEERISSGLSFSAAYKFNKKTSIQGAYRFYTDDWGIVSNTITLNSYIEVLPKLTLMPLIRYYKQSEADFFKEHKSTDFHFSKDSYGTSDERMGAYDGTTYSLGLEYELSKNMDLKVIGATQEQSFGLKMNWLTAGIDFRF